MGCPTPAAVFGVGTEVHQSREWRHPRALLDQDFEFLLKGGTSLSKGFGIIQRFSEDLDIRVEPGTADGIQRDCGETSSDQTTPASRSCRLSSAV